MIMGSGNFSFTGSSVSFNPMYAEVGAFVFTGFPASHAYSGSYTITPIDTGFDIICRIGSGSFDWTGVAANHAFAGSYLINNLDYWYDTLTVLGEVVGIGSGSFALAGTDARFNRMSPIVGVYSISGELDFRVAFNAEPVGDLSYLCTLTGSPDLDLKINSFQAIKKKDKPTFLQVVIPGGDQEFAVYSRSNGQLRIDMGYVIEGEIHNRKTIVQADLEDIMVYNGANRKTITLLAYSTSIQTNNTVEIAQPIYKSTLNGILRYRFASPNLYVEPGDRVIVGNDTFTANSITYFISPKYSSMEIAEEQ